MPPAPTRSIRRRVAFGAVASLLVLAGLAFLGPFPVRTWWAQRQRTQELQRQISVVQKANDELANRAKALNDPANIERLARRDYGMVRDGERAYALLPPPKVPVTLPPVWPFVTVSPRGPTTGQPAPAP